MDQNTTEPIRVLQINSGSRSFGGVSSFLYNVYTNIDRKQVQFDFLSPNVTTYGIHRDEIEEMGGRIYELGVTGNILTKKTGLYKRLSQFLAQHKYFIVHINSGNFFFNLFAVLAVRKAGVPCRIVHSHNAGDTSRSRIKKAAFEALKPQLEKNATMLLACSRKAARYMFTDKTVKAGKVEIVKNGINADRFHFDPEVRQAVRRELGLTDQFVVGHVGRFFKQKNHAFLIRIFEKIHETEPESVLLLFGKGDLEPEIKDLVKERGLTSCVRFMGEVADIERMYQAMDVFVMPSFHEGLPVSCVEIQAAGVPCVLSDTITEEIRIEDSMQFLSLKQSPEEWAAAALSKKGCRDLDGYENVIRSGYAIRDVANGMLKMYKGMVKDLHRGF